jgi:hypothetical protein
VRSSHIWPGRDRHSDPRAAGTLLLMTYVVVFDIPNAGYKSLSFPAFGLIFVAVGILLVLFRRRIPRRSERGTVARLIFPYGFLSFAILWTQVSFVSTYRDYRAASSARQDNSARVVEGVVTDFKRMPAAGHAMESFCVSGVCFDYSVSSANIRSGRLRGNH